MIFSALEQVLLEVPSHVYLENQLRNDSSHRLTQADPDRHELHVQANQVAHLHQLQSDDA